VNKVETLIGYAFAVLVGLAVGIGATRMTYPPAAVDSPAATDLVAVGKTYKASLANSYRLALLAGAQTLDGGGTVEQAISDVARLWLQNRTQLYEQSIVPALAKIVPQGTPDANVTAAQKAEMATAFRSLAKGLSQ
jgi:hypothetical protein